MVSSRLCRVQLLNKREHSLLGKTKDAEQKVFLANKGAEQEATVLNKVKQLQRCFQSQFKMKLLNELN
jgi:hypothetical protein